MHSVLFRFVLRSVAFPSACPVNHVRGSQRANNCNSNCFNQIDYRALLSVDFNPKPKGTEVWVARSGKYPVSKPLRPRHSLDHSRRLQKCQNNVHFEDWLRANPGDGWLVHSCLATPLHSLCTFPSQAFM